MPEKPNLTNLEFGTRSVQKLALDAYQRASQTLEDYDIQGDAERLQLLYQYHTEEIYPQLYSAWHFTLLHTLKDADLAQLTTGHVEQWYRGFVPTGGDDDYAWRTGTFCVIIDTPMYDPSSAVGHSREELGRLHQYLQSGFVEDQSDIRARAITTYVDGHARIKIELFDDEQAAATARMTKYYLTADGVIAQRAAGTSYFCPRDYTKERDTRNIQGVVRESTPDEFLEMSCYAKADAEVLGEFGLVVAGGSQRLPFVVELANYNSDHSPGLSDPSE